MWNLVRPVNLTTLCHLRFVRHRRPTFAGGMLRLQFSCWLAVSPAFLHHDLAGENFLLIPVVTIVLALFVPISPLSAAWISLALFAANFVIGPLSNRLHGSQYDTAFIYEARERGKQLSILWIGFGTAVVASSI